MFLAFMFCVICKSSAFTEQQSRIVIETSVQDQNKTLTNEYGSDNTYFPAKLISVSCTNRVELVNISLTIQTAKCLVSKTKVGYSSRKRESCKRLCLRFVFHRRELGLIQVKPVKVKHDRVIRISEEVCERVSLRARTGWRDGGGAILVITPSHLRKGFLL